MLALLTPRCTRAGEGGVISFYLPLPLGCMREYMRACMSGALGEELPMPIDRHCLLAHKSASCCVLARLRAHVGGGVGSGRHSDQKKAVLLK